MSNSILERRIRDAVRQQVSKIDLRKIRLLEFPVQVLALEHLKELELKVNRISKLPPETGKLDKLEVFEYEGNPLSEPAFWFLDEGYLPSAWFKKPK